MHYSCFPRVVPNRASQSITALARPSSLNKPQNEALKSRGVQVVAADLSGPEADLVKILEGVDVVVSAVGAPSQLDQIPLANAAKKAGVKRFLPCGLMTVAPPGGIMFLRDMVRSSSVGTMKQALISITEGASLQSCEAAGLAIHDCGRGLVVPDLLSPACIWQD